jgi:hypothetical protein
VKGSGTTCPDSYIICRQVGVADTVCAGLQQPRCCCFCLQTLQRPVHVIALEAFGHRVLLRHHTVLSGYAASERLSADQGKKFKVGCFVGGLPRLPS